MSGRSPVQVVQLTPPGRGAIATLLVERPGAVELLRGRFFPNGGWPLESSPLDQLIIGRFGRDLGEEVVVRRRRHARPSKPTAPMLSRTKVDGSGMVTMKISQSLPSYPLQTTLSPDICGIVSSYSLSVSWTTFQAALAGRPASARSDKASKEDRFIGSTSTEKGNRYLLSATQPNRHPCNAGLRAQRIARAIRPWPVVYWHPPSLSNSSFTTGRILKRGTTVPPQCYRPGNSGRTILISRRMTPISVSFGDGKACARGRRGDARRRASGRSAQVGRRLVAASKGTKCAEDRRSRWFNSRRRGAGQ